MVPDISELDVSHDRREQHCRRPPQYEADRNEFRSTGDVRDCDRGNAKQERAQGEDQQAKGPHRQRNRSDDGPKSCDLPDAPRRHQQGHAPKPDRQPIGHELRQWQGKCGPEQMAKRRKALDQEAGGLDGGELKSEQGRGRGSGHKDSNHVEPSPHRGGFKRQFGCPGTASKEQPMLRQPPPSDPCPTVHPRTSPTRPGVLPECLATLAACSRHHPSQICPLAFPEQGHRRGRRRRARRETVLLRPCACGHERRGSLPPSRLACPFRPKRQRRGPCAPPPSGDQRRF